MSAAPMQRPVMGSRGHSQDNVDGPVRYPRPMTAAELHLELEQEQEAVVNRLTRELTALRAHSASVASTTSTTSTTTTASTSAIDASTVESSHQYIIPTSSRRHRSSSNLSASSNRSSAAVNIPITQPGSNVPPASGTSQASFDRARDATGASLPGITTRSRQNSTVLPIRSGAPSPSLHMHPTYQTEGTAGTTYFSHRASMSSLNGSSYGGPGQGQGTARSPGVSSPRFEEVAHARAALESARSENEMLVEKIKALEREVKRRERVLEGHAGDG